MTPDWLHPFIAVGVTLAVFAVLQLRRGTPTDMLFLGALVVVTLTGVITPDQALKGFSSPALITVAGLLVVSAGLRVTGVLDWVGRLLLGGVDNERGALYRLAPTLVAASAFLLNTALVAMMMPVVIEWCRRRNIATSRMLIPLSYLVILGGVCTLVGTSTTLVVNGLLREAEAARLAEAQQLDADGQAGAERQKLESFATRVAPMSLFEIGRVGFPCAVVGAVFMLLAAPRLLPDRRDIVDQLGDQRREYLVEMLVKPECPLIGKSIEAAGLRHLPGLFLIEIDRDGEIITPVTPRDVIHAHDRLVFTGVVGTIVDLEKIPGLVPAADMAYEFHPHKRTQRKLTEVVLSRTSPLIGTTVREANFRQQYNAAVVAVHRNGVRLTNKIGNIVLEAGDTLLLQTRHEFVPTYRNSRDFYLVSSVEGAEVRLHHKMKLAAALGLVLIGWLCASTFMGEALWPGWASPPVAAVSIACVMMLLRCLRPVEARNALELQTLITIAGALGLGVALTESGAAAQIARFLVEQVGPRPLLLLIVMYLLTLVFTETITNNAVAAMLLPVAIGIAWEGGYDPRPFIMAISLSASLSFLTPIGYQTNLMIMGPGGYRPVDYLRCGVPLAALVACTALFLIPRIWHF